jgi:hypothetical protein
VGSGPIVLDAQEVRAPGAGDIGEPDPDLGSWPSVRRLSPNPTSLTMTGTGQAATISARPSSHSEKSRVPSGIAVSCTGLTWICRASAPSSSTARRASSALRPAPRLPMTKPSGLTSRMTVKPLAASASSRATLIEPQAMGRPVSAAARARSRLIRAVVSVPPVMPLT